MAKKKPLTQVDLIKNLRREIAPKEKTFKVKKNTPYRKRKHKGKIDD
jgi:hypothetical protein